MLDMGFEPQIREVMLNLPKPHQTLLFSATMPVEVETLAADYLNMPVKIKVGAVSVPTANVSQHLEKLVDAQKVDRLCELLLEGACCACPKSRHTVCPYKTDTLFYPSQKKPRRKSSAERFR